MLPLLFLLTLGTAEQTYGPYARPDRGGVQSIVAARGRVLLAWSEKVESGHARVHVVLLNAAGEAISPIRVLPALSPNRDAVVPAVGTDGMSFLVVWEEVLGVQQSVALALGPGLEPTGAPQPVGNPVTIPGNEYEPARVTWHNGSYAVYTGTKNSWRVAAAGMPIGAVNMVPMAVAADGSVGHVTSRRVVTGTIGRPGGTTYYYAIAWQAGAAAATEIAFATEASAPVIVAAGTKFVIVWTTRNDIHYRLSYELQRRVVNANVDESARPRIACGATQCVVVYGTLKGDVEGFVFDHTSRAWPTFFTVAKSERIEREPEVVLTSATRALVTWRSMGTDGEKLAGVTLRIGPTKHRATDP